MLGAVEFLGSGVILSWEELCGVTFVGLVNVGAGESGVG
jgi:hypothetical protein